MTRRTADNLFISSAPKTMRSKRFAILTIAAILAAGTAAPAIAQSQGNLTGLDRARQAMMQALDQAANSGDETPGVPPGDDPDDGKSNNGKSDDAKSDKGSDKGKSNNGKSDKGKSNNGKSDKGKSNNGKSDKGQPANNGSDKSTGRERAAQAIAKALELHTARRAAAAVIDKLMKGESPATLETDQSQGSTVTAMVKAYNELRARGNGSG